MVITINDYVTAVDDVVEHGNKLVYSMQIKDGENLKVKPELSELDLVTELIKELKENMIEKKHE